MNKAKTISMVSFWRSFAELSNGHGFSYVFPISWISNTKNILSHFHFCSSYIGNNLWFIHHFHDHFRKRQKLYKSRQSRTLWLDSFWNDISLKFTSHVFYKAKYHNFSLLFPQGNFYMYFFKSKSCPNKKS